MGMLTNGVWFSNLFRAQSEGVDTLARRAAVRTLIGRQTFVGASHTGNLEIQVTFRLMRSVFSTSLIDLSSGRHLHPVSHRELLSKPDCRAGTPATSLCFKGIDR